MMLNAAKEVSGSVDVLIALIEQPDRFSAKVTYDREIHAVTTV